MTTLLETLKRWRELLILAAFFATMGVGPARLYAENFVKQSVNSEIAALEAQIAELQKLLAEQNDTSAGTNARIETLTKLLEQQFALMQFLVNGERRTREGTP